MSRPSLSERYDQLVQEAERRPQVLVGAQPTDTHRRAIRLMTDLLSMAEKINPANVPVVLRTTARVIKGMEDELAHEFAEVPEQAIRSFLRELGMRMMDVTGDARWDRPATLPPLNPPDPDAVEANGHAPTGST